MLNFFSQSSPHASSTNAAVHQKPPLGVLTFHRCINYGSYWQARCLVEGLRARGHNAVLADHTSWRVNLAEWKCGLQPVLPTRVPKRDHLLYALKMLQFFRAFTALPRSARFPLERPAAMDSFDQLVVGSDEVWNLRHPWYGGCPLFFGVGTRTRRLVSYAASFGNYSSTQHLDESWANHLRGFAAISVRDTTAQRLIEAALGFVPELVLDPCLQFPPEAEGPWRGPREPFVAVYGHNFSPGFSRAVRQWADERGYPLVSIGYRNDWADTQWITAGPQDFAHGIAHAQAVATNFFHGCVFALRYAKPFVCETSPYRRTKIRDLMDLVGGERHLLAAEASTVHDIPLDQPLAPAIGRRIEELRQKSEAYLEHALV